MVDGVGVVACDFWEEELGAGGGVIFVAGDC